jgi:hypothetical protein
VLRWSIPISSVYTAQFTLEPGIFDEEFINLLSLRSEEVVGSATESQISGFVKISSFACDGLFCPLDHALQQRSTGVKT